MALVGAGAMGVNHARVLRESKRARLAVVVDADVERARRLAGGRITASSELAAAYRCDAAIVATPTADHAATTRTLLDADIPVLVEKPLAHTLSDVRSILSRSEERGVPLACGFVERFNPVVRCAAELLDDEPIHVIAMRHSPPTNGRATASVVQDLLVHDIDLAARFAGGVPPVSVGGAAWTPPGGTVSELADATLRFPTGLVATLSASRVGQRKVRTISITTPSSAIELDLLRQDVTVYRHRGHEQLVDGALTYRTETMIDIPFVRHAGEPLALQLEHFLDLVDGRVDADDERAGLIVPHEIAATIEGGAVSPPAEIRPAREPQEAAVAGR